MTLYVVICINISNTPNTKMPNLYNMQKETLTDVGPSFYIYVKNKDIKDPSECYFIWQFWCPKTFSHGHIQSDWKKLLNSVVYKTYSFLKPYFSIHFTTNIVHIFFLSQSRKMWSFNFLVMLKMKKNQVNVLWNSEAKSKAASFLFKSLKIEFLLPPVDDNCK